MCIINKDQKWSEIKTLYVSYEELSNIIVDKERINIDYKRIGLTYGVCQVNLSQIMYKDVIHEHIGYYGTRILVKEASYTHDNNRIVNDVIKTLVNHVMSRTLNDYSVQNMLREMIKFTEWLKSHDIKYPNTIEQAITVFQAYKEYLLGQIKTAKMKSNTAHARHVWSLHLLTTAVDDQDNAISEDVTTIPGTSDEGNEYGEIVKTQDEIERAFAFYYHFFDQVADFVLGNKDFPYTINLPRGEASLIPFKSKATVAPSYQDFQNGNSAVNYKNGKILNDEEIEKSIEHLNGKDKWNKRDSIKAARKKLSKVLLEANSTNIHKARMHLGKRAMNAWFMVMQAIVGMGDSTVGNLKWGEDNEFDITKESHEFITIKPRAMYKNVFFSIRKAFLKDFERFLKLRRYLLNGNSFDYLFFGGYDENVFRLVTQKNGGWGVEIHKSFLLQDNELPKVLGRDFRRDRGNDILSSKGLLAATMALQHTTKKHLQHYSGETKKEKAEQIHTFFNNVHDFVLDEPIETKQQSAAGGCDCEEILEPQAYKENVPVDPDCNNPQSCLWCIHFRTHTDREEIRKLLSIKYIIKEITFPRSESQAHYDAAMEPWLKRIEEFLDAMREDESKADEMIAEVWYEVKYEGLLTPYWLSWVEMLEDLGRFA